MIAIEKSPDASSEEARETLRQRFVQKSPSSYGPMAQSPVINQILLFILEFNLEPADFVWENLGFASDGRPIILDYGYSDEIYWKYYDNKDYLEPAQGLTEVKEYIRHLLKL